MDLRVSALIGAVGIVAFPKEPQFYVLCAVAVSAVSSIVLQLIKGRQEQRRRDAEDQRYERDRQERVAHQTALLKQYEHTAELTISKAAEVKKEVGVAAAEVKREVNVAQALTATAAKELKTELGVNTDLTRMAAARAEASLVGKVADLTEDTNNVVHRIEDRPDSAG